MTQFYKTNKSVTRQFKLLHEGRLQRFIFGVSNVLLIFALIYTIHFSIEKAKTSITADFAAFYIAANVIIDPEVPNEELYDHLKMSDIYPKYGIDVEPAPYLYSLLVAYLMAPYALIPYDLAKTIWNLLSLVAYIGTIVIGFRLSGAPLRWLPYALTVLLIWFPFLCNQYWLQSNTFVALLIALAVLAATNNRPWLSGILIAVAAMIKLFPLAVASVLMLKNWRIGLTCFLVIGVSFLLPDSVRWLSAIQHGNHPNYTDAYRWLTSFGDVWFLMFAIFIAVITALLSYRAREAPYATLASLAASAAFLVSPVVGGYYLVVLAFAYVVVTGMVKDPVVLFGAFVSWFWLHISDGPSGAMLVLWLSMAWWIYNIPKSHLIK